eukprot:scaffold7242_cov400-Prasinococcus_capsulatus_cf.AAC.10
MDCIYFSITLLTTVGYGDFTPSTPTSMAFTSAYIFVGISLIAAALFILVETYAIRRASKVAVTLRSTQQLRVNSLKSRTNSEGGFIVDDDCDDIFEPTTPLTQAVKTARHVTWLGKEMPPWLLLVIGVASLYFVANPVALHGVSTAVQPWSGQAWASGVYFVMTTLTTIGFGDVTPASPVGKAITLVMMVLCVPVAAFILGRMTAAIWGADEQEAALAVVKGLTFDRAKALLEFEKVIADLGVGTTDDGRVNRLEFLIFMLQRNGIVEMKTIAKILENFDELDWNRTGYLELDYQTISEGSRRSTQKQGST